MRRVISLFNHTVAVFIQGTEMNCRMGRVEKETPHGTPEQQVVLREIFDIAKRAGVKKVYGPDPMKSNTEILTADDPKFSQTITLPPEEKGYEGMELLRGPEAYADGMEIPPLVAFWEILADCLVVIIRDPKTGKVVATHAGRDSLLDWGRILGTGGRENESSIDAAMAHFKESDPATLQCAAIFGIGYQHFKHPIDHPRYGEKNRKMIDYVSDRWPNALPGNDKDLGELSLKGLACDQLMTYGVRRKNIFTNDDIDTYSDAEPQTGGGAKWIFFSQRRGDHGRNGFMLVHHGRIDKRK